MLTLAQSHASCFSALQLRLVVSLLVQEIKVPEEGPRESTPLTPKGVVEFLVSERVWPFPLLFPCQSPILKNIRID